MTDVAYTMNLQHRGVTRYTHWPFIRVARLRGTYLGIDAGNLYQITGSTADGSDIDCAIEFGPHDFGSDEQKRLKGLYVGARYGGDLSATVGNDAAGTRQYTLPSNATTGLRQRRAPLGRGRRGKYWTVLLENVTGGTFDIDTLVLLATVLRRRLT